MANASGDSAFPRVEDIDNIAVIGEYTCYSVPEQDHHYVVLVHSDGTWKRWPSLAKQDGVFATQALESMLGMPLETTLDDVLGQSSRVLYPPEAVGLPLIEFQPVKMGFLSRLLYRFMGVAMYELDLSSEAKEFVRSLGKA
jgi:hypothetical protein